MLEATAETALSSHGGRSEYSYAQHAVFASVQARYALSSGAPVPGQDHSGHYADGARPSRILSGLLRPHPPESPVSPRHYQPSHQPDHTALPDRWSAFVTRSSVHANDALRSENQRVGVPDSPRAPR